MPHNIMCGLVPGTVITQSQSSLQRSQPPTAQPPLPPQSLDDPETKDKPKNKSVFKKLFRKWFGIFPVLLE